MKALLKQLKNLCYFKIKGVIEMVSKNTIVNNLSGLHARPAASFSQFCNTFPNTITLTYEGLDINPKSIIMLMLLLFSRENIRNIS